jgi:hypothetical protein
MSALLIRLAKWIEDRRKVPYRSFNAIVADLQKQISEVQKPSAEMKELALLKARMDRVELVVGLKRDPIALVVPGEARIA